jgi:hypothetical protein
MSTKHIGYETGRTEIGDIDRAETFGRLIGITRPILAFYCSDLYHDARWIHDNVTGPDVTFYFGVRESGTSIGFDHALVKAYNVAVRQDWVSTVSLPGRLVGRWRRATVSRGRFK